MEAVEKAAKEVATQEGGYGEKDDDDVLVEGVGRGS